jgi:hypothetical protein
VKKKTEKKQKQKKNQAKKESVASPPISVASLLLNVARVAVVCSPSPLPPSLSLFPPYTLHPKPHRVCGTTGALEYGRVPGLDVFPSEASAVQHLKHRGLANKQVTHGCALLGCAVFGDTAVTLIARKVRTAVVLPNGHEVLTVTEAQWIRVPLRNPAAVLTREERANVQSLTEIPLENLYFFCETFDVTRAFAHAGVGGLSLTPLPGGVTRLVT